MRLVMCLAVSLALPACSVKPPKGWICMLNAESGYNLCFDMSKDFDAEGKVRAGVKGQRVPISSLQQLQGFVNLDPDSFVNLKAYILKQKQRCEAKQ